MNCTDPECGSSPINIKLNAIISDTTQVITLGDTINFSLFVPRVVQSNYGEYLVSSIDESGSWFSLDYSFVDSIYVDGTGKLELLNKTIQFKRGGFKNKQTSIIYFNGESKSIEFLLIPSKKGKYYISSSIQSSRFIFQDQDKGWLLGMLNVGLENPNKHHELYLSWIPDITERALMRQKLSDIERAGSFLYAFEVK